MYADRHKACWPAISQRMAKHANAKHGVAVRGGTKMTRSHDARSCWMRVLNDAGTAAPRPTKKSRLPSGCSVPSIQQSTWPRSPCKHGPTSSSCYGLTLALRGDCDCDHDHEYNSQHELWRRVGPGLHGRGPFTFTAAVAHFLSPTVEHPRHAAQASPH